MSRFVLVAYLSDSVCTLFVATLLSLSARLLTSSLLARLLSALSIV